MADTILSLERIGKKFKSETALKDISISMEPGEILGFLGPSGAGKTTTIKIITGQLRQTSGTAKLFGKDTRQLDHNLYSQIGIVTDQSGVYERMNVYDNLPYFAKILNVPKERIEEVLKRVGLWEHRKKPASKLSKGQGQRLVLSRAVLHQPKLLFLDEPTSGLDPSTAQQIHRFLMDLKNQGMAIFLTTHNMEEASKLCDMVALLNEGCIVEQGEPREVCLKYNTKKQYRILLDDRKEVVLPQSEESAGQIARWIKENRIEAIHSCEPTLEHVFLAVTGRELQS